MRESLTRILAVAIMVGSTIAFPSPRSQPFTLRSAMTVTVTNSAAVLAEEDTDAESNDNRWSSNNTTALFPRQRAYEYVETPSTSPFSPEDVTHITEQIQARSGALQESQEERANGIRTHLLSNYNVILRDKNRQWFRAGKNQHVFNATASEALPELQAGNGGRRFKEQVRTLLQQRTWAREVQDYAQADAVKATLRTTYGVTISEPPACRSVVLKRYYSNDCWRR